MKYITFRQKHAVFKQFAFERKKLNVYVLEISFYNSFYKVYRNFIRLFLQKTCF